MLYLKQCDVLDIEVDALIYSTNVLLNCTGGVGACLVSRYGRKVQAKLHHLLAASGRRFAKQGEIFDHITLGMPYRRVFHTCPCDGWYDTSTEIVAATLTRCLQICSADPAIETVAMSALATGYGHLELDAFVRTAAALSMPADLTVTLAIDHDLSFAQIVRLAAEENLHATEAPIFQ